jgi:hypothetical protein
MILFAADAGFWLSILFPLVMFIIWVLNQAIGRAGQPPNPQRRPGLPPQQPPRPVQARVDEEIEAFLRRAAQQRGAADQRPAAPAPAPQPTAPRTLVQRNQPVASPLRPAEAIVQVEVVDESDEGPRDIHTATVAEHVQRHLDTREFQQRATTITKVDQADEELEQRLHQAFDHEVGSLAAQAKAQQTAAAASAAATATKVTAGGVYAMLKDPNSLRNAIIMQEILRRPDSSL